jgi:hypothetical protein
MKTKHLFSILIIILIITGCSSSRLSVRPRQDEKWRAIHLLNYNSDNDLVELGKLIPKLDSLGINVIILEVDYHFEFESHPELRQGESLITKKGAREFAEICRKNHIKLIPQFQCVGHQSWAEQTFPLLTKYPELDLTPGAFPGNKDIYCREWDVTNPKVYEIVFDLLDEIIDAFEADAFHVGMDEVFLLGSEQSPSTKGKDPGELFANAVNDIYNYLVLDKGVEMLMWSDRLFDGKKFGIDHEWEASQNGTATALDKIPRDIIMCPWHYEKMDTYPSIPNFIKEGFRVLPSSWREVDAAKLLIDYSYKQTSPLMLGHMFTTWGKTDLLKYPTLIQCIDLILKHDKTGKLIE